MLTYLILQCVKSQIVMQQNYGRKMYAEGEDVRNKTHAGILQ